MKTTRNAIPPRTIPRVWFSVSFAMDNAAFEEAGMATETARILEMIAEDVRDGYTSRAIRDVNGNTIGEWGVNGLR